MAINLNLTLPLPPPGWEWGEFFSWWEGLSRQEKINVFKGLVALECDPDDEIIVRRSQVYAWDDLCQAVREAWHIDDIPDPGDVRKVYQHFSTSSPSISIEVKGKAVKLFLTPKGVFALGSKGDLYSLKRTSQGWICSCPGFKFRKSCRHTMAAQQMEDGDGF